MLVNNAGIIRDNRVEDITDDDWHAVIDVSLTGAFQDPTGHSLAVALGGDCLADVAMLRAVPAVFGPVASDPTVSRLIDTLAASGKNALRAIVPRGLKSADMSGGWPTGRRLMRAGR